MNWPKDLVDYRREKAAKTLDDAVDMVNKKSFLSAVNRMYYALFYEVTALLLLKNLSSPKHTGIRSLFNEHFIRTGIVSVELGKFYSKIFDFRQEGDYADFVVFEELDVKEWLKKSQRYIDELEAIITEQMK